MKWSPTETSIKHSIYSFCTTNGGNISENTTFPKLWSTWKLWLPFPRGNVFHANTSSSVSRVTMSIKVLSSRHRAVQQKGPKCRQFLPIQTFPRHVSQQRAAGVNKVGAASRREISIKTKNRAVGAAEYVDLKGMGLSRPRGLRQGARGKRHGGLRCLGGGTTGNDRIIRKSIWQEINTVWARLPKGSKPDIVENYNKPSWKGYENLSYRGALETTY